MRRLAVVLILVITLTGCNSYEIVGREDRYVNKDEQPVPTALSPGYDHDEVQFILKHYGQRIYAVCDLSTVNNLEPSASCALRPLQSYKCVVGRGNPKKDQFPLSDLTCKDANGNNVYLYVTKKE